MSDRYDNDRDRRFGESRSDERGGGRGESSGYRGSRDDDRSDWARNREGRGWQATSNEPRYSSDEDETYGSEWQRGREPRPNDRFERARSYAQSERDSGWYRQGNAGMYGSGSNGGYLGGRSGGGYGGGTGTDYSGGDYSGGASRPGGYGSTQGGSYGTGYQSRYGSRNWNEQGWGEGRGFGGGRDQGYRGRDVGSPGARIAGSTGGGFAGRGPKGYSRSDDRIREDICDRLSVDDDVDASEIEVRVQAGEVTLEGSVPTRMMKHDAENLADEVLGVKDVHNNLRVVKGLLSEIKDKITGTDAERHYANQGTKNTPATSAPSTATGTNGRL